MNILVSGLFSAAESYGKETAAFEIILMLLVAFILGYLLRYFLGSKSSGNEWEAKYKELFHQHELLQNKLKMFETENRKLSDELKACLEGSKQTTGLGFVSKAAPGKKDDLKKVEGIGPKIEQMLNAEGIYTFAQLAQTEVSFIQSILDKGGPAYKVHNPESWPFQAKMAAEGKWDELKKWQDEHKHGRF
jgi:predicted flap endonuclease-1-like 5' DNA nuclease